MTDISELPESPYTETELPVGLPMARRLELLSPETPRLKVHHQTPRIDLPIPNGWFAIARIGEIAPGEIRALHYFGLDLVAFADEDGKVHLVEAYCPHFGAHLAVGGKVDSGHLVCPFHGWKFEGTTGRCVEIPYASSERIPARAKVRAFEVHERNGLVFAWHHTKGGEPFYELPTIPEFTDPGHLPPLVKEFRIATAVQEMADNNHDFAHFLYVHGTESIPEGEETIEGTYKRTRNPGLERETFGLGLGVVRRSGVATFMSSVTPIDSENVHIRWVFTAPKELGADRLEFVANSFAEGVSQDVPIWENKRYVARPVLTKGEAGMARHRRWCRQFYSEPVEVPDEE